MEDNIEFCDPQFWGQIYDPETVGTVFELPLGKAKKAIAIKHVKGAPSIYYTQITEPTCCMSNLANSFHAYGNKFAADRCVYSIY